MSMMNSALSLRGRNADVVAEDRRNRRAHPYSRPPPSDTKDHELFTSFGFGKFHEMLMLQNLTTCLYAKERMRKQPLYSRGRRFVNYRFQRSTVDEEEREIEKEKLLRKDDIPDFDKKSMIADHVEKLMNNEDQAEDDSLSAEVEISPVVPVDVFPRSSESGSEDDERVSTIPTQSSLAMSLPSEEVSLVSSSNNKAAEDGLSSEILHSQPDSANLSSELLLSSTLLDGMIVVSDAFDKKSVSPSQSPTEGHMTMDVVGTPDDKGSAIDILLAATESKLPSTISIEKETSEQILSSEECTQTEEGKDKTGTQGDAGINDKNLGSEYILDAPANKVLESREASLELVTVETSNKLRGAYTTENSKIHQNGWFESVESCKKELFNEKCENSELQSIVTSKNSELQSIVTSKDADGRRTRNRSGEGDSRQGNRENHFTKSRSQSVEKASRRCASLEKHFGRSSKRTWSVEKAHRKSQHQSRVKSFRRSGSPNRGNLFRSSRKQRQELSARPRSQSRERGFIRSRSQSRERAFRRSRSQSRERAFRRSRSQSRERNFRASVWSGKENLRSSSCRNITTSDETRERRSPSEDRGLRISRSWSRERDLRRLSLSEEKDFRMRSRSLEKYSKTPTPSPQKDCKISRSPNCQRYFSGSSPNEERHIYRSSPNEERHIYRSSPNEERNICRSSPNEERHIYRSSPNEERHIYRSSPNEERHICRSSPNEERHICRSSPNEERHIYRSSPNEERHICRSSPNEERHIYRSSPSGERHIYRSSPNSERHIYRSSTRGERHIYRSSTRGERHIYRSSPSGERHIYRSTPDGERHICRSSSSGERHIYRSSPNGERHFRSSQSREKHICGSNPSGEKQVGRSSHNNIVLKCEDVRSRSSSLEKKFSRLDKYARRSKTGEGNKTLWKAISYKAKDNSHAVPKSLESGSEVEFVNKPFGESQRLESKHCLSNLSSSHFQHASGVTEPQVCIQDQNLPNLFVSSDCPISASSWQSEKPSVPEVKDERDTHYVHKSLEREAYDMFPRAVSQIDDSEGPKGSGFWAEAIQYSQCLNDLSSNGNPNPTATSNSYHKTVFHACDRKLTNVSPVTASPRLACHSAVLSMAHTDDTQLTGTWKNLIGPKTPPDSSPDEAVWKPQKGPTSVEHRSNTSNLVKLTADSARALNEDLSFSSNLKVEEAYVLQKFNKDIQLLVSEVGAGRSKQDSNETLKSRNFDYSIDTASTFLFNSTEYNLDVSSSSLSNPQEDEAGMSSATSCQVTEGSDLCHQPNTYYLQDQVGVQPVEEDSDHRRCTPLYFESSLHASQSLKDKIPLAAPCGHVEQSMVFPSQSIMREENLLDVNTDFGKLQDVIVTKPCEDKAEGPGVQSSKTSQSTEALGCRNQVLQTNSPTKACSSHGTWNSPLPARDKHVTKLSNISEAQAQNNLQITFEQLQKCIDKLNLLKNEKHSSVQPDVPKSQAPVTAEPSKHFFNASTSSILQQSIGLSPAANVRTDVNKTSSYENRMGSNVNKMESSMDKMESNEVNTKQARADIINHSFTRGASLDRQHEQRKKRCVVIHKLERMKGAGALDEALLQRLIKLKDEERKEEMKAGMRRVNEVEKDGKGTRQKHMKKGSTSRYALCLQKITFENRAVVCVPDPELAKKGYCLLELQKGYVGDPRLKSCSKMYSAQQLKRITSSKSQQEKAEKDLIKENSVSSALTTEKDLIEEKSVSSALLTEKELIVEKSLTLSSALTTEKDLIKEKSVSSALLTEKKLIVEKSVNSALTTEKDLIEEKSVSSALTPEKGLIKEKSVSSSLLAEKELIEKSMSNALTTKKDLIEEKSVNSALTPEKDLVEEMSVSSSLWTIVGMSEDKAATAQGTLTIANEHEEKPEKQISPDTTCKRSDNSSDLEEGELSDNSEDTVPDSHQNPKTGAENGSVRNGQGRTETRLSGLTKVHSCSKNIKTSRQFESPRETSNSPVVIVISETDSDCSETMLRSGRKSIKGKSRDIKLKDSSPLAESYRAKYGNNTHKCSPKLSLKRKILLEKIGPENKTIRSETCGKYESMHMNSPCNCLACSRPHRLHEQFRRSREDKRESSSCEKQRHASVCFSLRELQKTLVSSCVWPVSGKASDVTMSSRHQCSTKGNSKLSSDQSSSRKQRLTTTSSSSCTSKKLARANGLPLKESHTCEVLKVPTESQDLFRSSRSEEMETMLLFHQSQKQQTEKLLELPTRSGNTKKLTNIIVAGTSALTSYKLLRELLQWIDSLPDLSSRWIINVHIKRKASPLDSDFQEVTKCLQLINSYQLKRVVNLVSKCSCRKQPSLTYSGLLQCALNRQAKANALGRIILLIGDDDTSDTEGIDGAFVNACIVKISDILSILKTEGKV